MLCAAIFLFPLNGFAKPVHWTFKDLQYGSGELGSDEKQTLNIMLPHGESEAHAIVYIHGGFYFLGSKVWYPEFLTDYSDKAVFATINYRLLNITDNKIHMDDMLSDVDAALSKIVFVAKENGITIKDVILVGHSAGAHIALLYGYKYFETNAAKKINIAACISLSGPSDFTDDIGWSSMSEYGNDLSQRMEKLSWIGSELVGTKIELTQYNFTTQSNYPDMKNHIESISPITFVYKNGKVPPTLLVHDLDDTIVPYSNSVKLNAALDKTTVPHKFITVTGSGNNHMLGGFPNKAILAFKPIVYRKQQWVKDAKAWLENYLQ
jgi:acetyl esterase/lipase